MKENQKAWMKRNLPLIAVVLFAILALLYLGDDIVKKQQNRISIEPIPPTVEVDDPKQGAAEGVLIVEYGEFSCTVCAAQVEILKDIVNDYPNDVQLVWKDAPLDLLRPESKNASMAAHCAGKQNKFWEMHDLLFERQDELGPELYTELAKELELDETQFAQCVDDKETLEKVNENIQSANDAQVAATPTFYIGGQKFEGYMEYTDFITAFSRL